MHSAPSGRSGLSRFLSAAAVGAVAGAALLGAAPAMAADATIIDVYTMNDFHGRLEATAGASVSQSTAGAASIASAFSTLKAENPDNSILVSAGDNVGASTFTSLVQDDNPTIDALNEIGLSATAIGNHELDHGREDLDDRIIPRADYEHISANLLEKGTDEHAYAPSYVQDFDGVKVGFIGAVTEDLPYLVSPDGIATLDVAPIVDSINDETARLQDGIDDSADASIPAEQKNLEADVVIAVMHEGAASPDVSFTDPASVFGTIVNGIGGNVDAIVSGHTHQAYDQEVTVDGNTLPVLQTGSYGTYLGHLELTVDPATKDLTSITSNLVDLLQPVQVTDPKGVVSTVYQPIYTADSTPVGQTVAALVQDAVDVANVEGAVSIGSVTADIRRGVQSDGTENRGAESTIGNLVADAQLWATQAELGTQIAFMNPGGIRQDITYATSGEGDADGNVTYREAAIVQPFANTLVTETLTGAQIKTVLEQQWQPGKSRPELHLGISADLSYTYDPTAEVGSHITGVFFQGEPIADDATFKIVTNSFLGAGGDNFTELGNGTDKADSGRVDLNAFTDYMAAFSPVTPDPASRSIGIVETSEEGAETLSYDLSSLDVNNSTVRDDEVQVLIDGEQVTTAPIDHSIVDTTDEQGRASVGFSISELAAGDHELEFVLPTTGVSVLYTLTVTESATPTPAPTPVETVVPTTPSTPAPAVHAPTTPTKHLAATGVDATPAFAAGIAALLLGLGMTAARLRRRSTVK
ncbi:MULTISPECIES: bifunctional metallophosphatase/5'-nucleotidase [unclassified Rathayibacter]|uniref:bifunctional metallophosphatase/5'-nucleotidase n=1 Tax=unclassified Rathayibacter TaxID=2609250 RepID=UPI0006FBA0BB|nr:MULTISPECIES: bifunctional UDP-sugar hydrolase/5'-nucleotidase [unclassified Rathayibacter]KQQ00085.1 multifunctional 2',3'-cyclic-nucleotide 2'-phosphodiesterase/5'-nucleotidase/3'-nucleotidase [Rathayibacter sp. Leaf294]KQS09539.1 multifunctional 2',3'-cyclic-nucleotide 2'-phosphodiesterase/5'-nucleotidase/3'-nucleotidase [Rathayibacter sp. Leaf185]